MSDSHMPIKISLYVMLNPITALYYMSSGLIGHRLEKLPLYTAVFGIFAVFVLPKMKVDPEEYRELVDSAKGLTSGAAQPQQASPGRQRRIADR